MSEITEASRHVILHVMPWRDRSETQHLSEKDLHLHYKAVSGKKMLFILRHVRLKHLVLTCLCHCVFLTSEQVCARASVCLGVYVEAEGVCESASNICCSATVDVMYLPLSSSAEECVSASVRICCEI